MILDLGGKWSLLRASGADPLSAARKRKGWLEGRVPGCVHLDLMAAGQIPDPFYALNELQVQWVEQQDWLYARRFRCPAEALEAERVELVCEGLDTYATVLLNGQEVGRADNMFCSWRWDVKDVLRSGPNRLLVHFASPIKTGRALVAEHGPLPAVGEPARVYTRKEQCATGWDWGPRLNSCGIWRPIYLHAWSGARIADVHAPVDWSDPKRPVIKLAVEVEASRAGQVRLVAELDSGQGAAARAVLEEGIAAGRNVLSADLAVSEPRLWWPRGQGEPHLYELNLSAAMDGAQFEERSLRVGLRRVELRREADAHGESFVIQVNGRPVFCKGANWVPADSFLPRVTRERCEDLVRKAADANMNMLRVWGGGIYETDEFYEACDRLGVMVWQDFAFSCACYPDHLDWFMESVRREAEQNVRRLRNHPSLVLWCGNNENQWGYHDWWGRPAVWGEKIYHELLPEVCARLDPDRPYWPGSPWGGETPNSLRAGDQHLWDVWFNWEPPERYRSQNGRFVSEFGMQAPPALETIHEYVPARERHMQSRTMIHHNKAELGTERLYRYLAGQFRVPGSFEDTVYLMQLVQAEAIKTGVAHWRARKFATAGALFWQLNDCWPVTSWSCIDSRGRPKALYYYARRAFAPVLAVASEDAQGLSVLVVNDAPERFEGIIACGLADVGGDRVWSTDIRVAVAPNAVEKLPVRKREDLRLSHPTREFFWCRLLKNGSLLSADARFFVPYMHVSLPPVGWEVGVRQVGEGRFVLTLESSAFAKGVWLRLEGVEAQFEDNFFDALASVPVTVGLRVGKDASAESVRRRLRIKTVADV